MKRSELSLQRGRRISIEVKRGLVDDYRRSGLSAREFCRQRGVSSSAFYRWLKEVEEEVESAGPSFVELAVPLHGRTSVEVVLSGGSVVRFETDERALPDLLLRLVSGGNSC